MWIIFDAYPLRRQRVSQLLDGGNRCQDTRFTELKKESWDAQQVRYAQNSLNFTFVQLSNYFLA